jgi:hypothetical protein
MLEKVEKVVRRERIVRGELGRLGLEPLLGQVGDKEKRKGRG